MLGGTALGTLFTANLPNASAEETSSTWTYEPLNSAQVAQRAYDLYAEGGCMYAAFRSIVEQVGLRRVEKHPLEEARWKGFPYRMMTYGKGGLQDYGSLCGILNGCAAAIALFVTDREDAASLTHALFHFYEDTLLPIFVPARMSSARFRNPFPSRNLSRFGFALDHQSQRNHRFASS